MPSLDIDGFSTDETSVIRRWAQEALEFLDAKEDRVRIRPFIDPPHGIFAQANDEEVQIDRRVFSDDLPPMGPPPTWYVGYLLYEEIAHSLLGRAGVLHGTLVGTFFQKLYATWVQAAAVNAGRIRATTLSSTPVPLGIQGRHLYYNVGKQLGMAMAGSRENERYLEAWAKSPEADPTLAALVEDVRKELSAPLTREAVLKSYRLHRN